MTPIYDALCRAAQHAPHVSHADGIVADLGTPIAGRRELRLVPPAPSIPGSAIRPAGATPSAFPMRVLSTTRTPPWQAGLLP